VAVGESKRAVRSAEFHCHKFQCIQSPNVSSESRSCAEQMAGCTTLWLCRTHNFIRRRMQCRSTKIEASDAPETKTGPKYSNIITGITVFVLGLYSNWN